MPPSYIVFLVCLIGAAAQISDFGQAPNRPNQLPHQPQVQPQPQQPSTSSEAPVVSAPAVPQQQQEHQQQQSQPQHQPTQPIVSAPAVPQQQEHQQQQSQPQHQPTQPIVSAPAVPQQQQGHQQQQAQFQQPIMTAPVVSAPAVPQQQGHQQQHQSQPQDQNLLQENSNLATILSHPESRQPQHPQQPQAPTNVQTPTPTVPQVSEQNIFALPTPNASVMVNGILTCGSRPVENVLVDLIEFDDKERARVVSSVRSTETGEIHLQANLNADGQLPRAYVRLTSQCNLEERRCRKVEVVSIPEENIAHGDRQKVPAFDFGRLDLSQSRENIQVQC